MSFWVGLHCARGVLAAAFTCATGSESGAVSTI